MHHSASLMPSWDLSGLEDGAGPPEPQQRLQALRLQAQALSTRCRGQLGTLSDDALLGVVHEFEQLLHATHLESCRAQLRADQAADDAAAQAHAADVDAQARHALAPALFVEHELAALDDCRITALLACPGAGQLAPWLARLRADTPWRLSAPVERYMAEVRAAAEDSWVRLYYHTLGALRVEVRGAAMALADAQALLREADAELRAQAWQGIAAALAPALPTCVLVFNALLQARGAEQRLRRQPTPWTALAVHNGLDPELFDTLVATVREARPRLSHRYYERKARLLSRARLTEADRQAPLPNADQRRWSWAEACDLAVATHAALAPRLGELARHVLHGGQVDAQCRPGKRGGAYTFRTVPGRPSYVSLQFRGSRQDVLTLVHELGHAIHQSLAAGQGMLGCAPPMVIGEAVPLLAEMVAHDLMREAAPDAPSRAAQLGAQVEALLDRLVRQAAILEFECTLHLQHRGAELSAARLGACWVETVGDSLGPAFTPCAGFQQAWVLVPHLFQAPFYVHAYAAASCVAAALYQARAAQPGRFDESLVALMEAGGSADVRTLLAPFGLDLSDHTWRSGLEAIDALLQRWLDATAEEMPT